MTLLSELRDSAQSEPEIQKVLVATTAHVALEDTQLFHSCKHLCVYEFEYGWWLHVDHEDLDDVDFQQDLAGHGFSPAVYDLLNWAKDLGCYFVKLDQDGPVYKGKKIHEW